MSSDEKRLNELSKKFATRDGLPWEEHEDDVILNGTDSMYKRSLALGRTLAACRRRRTALLQKVGANRGPIEFSVRGLPSPPVEAGPVDVGPGVDVFQFKGHEVRVVTDNSGEPRWVASDVAKILGYAAAKDMTRNLRDRHKGGQIVPTPGGNQEMTVITEAGLYAAVLKSRVPAAVEFQDWVTDEVLPSIRKHGAYMTPAKIEEALLNPDTLIQLATTLKEERQKRIEAEAMRAVAIESKERAEARALELAPKAQKFERFVNSEGLADWTTVARVLGVKKNKMLNELRKQGVLMARGPRHNVPYAQYMHHFEVRPYTFSRYGSEITKYDVKVKPGGVDFLTKKLSAFIAQHS